MDGLEETRKIHEEKDKLEMLFVEEMLTLNPNNHRERIDKEHKLKVFLDQYVRCTKTLHAIYNQRLGKRRILSEDPFHEFYAQLNDILDKNLDVAIIQPNELVEEQDEEIQVTNSKQVLFTDEEGHGKYFDLNQGHMAYCQLVKIDYLTFIRELDQTTKVSTKLKSTIDYERYLHTMLDYFRDFTGRAKPLLDYRDLERKVEEEVAKEWAKNRIDLDNIETWEELASLGLDKLKAELQARGLKCGGTLEERSKRLMSIKGKQPEEIDLSLRPSNLKATTKVQSNKKVKLDLSSKTSMEPYQLRVIEAKLIMYCEYYNDIKLATIENVQRKQSRTAEEREESDEDASDLDLDNDDEDEVVYNPKNLPLGWDGKPIPYWLYKLHGLNITFTCEICGNTVYKGPKTFQRHFSEWRHAQGMTALGIPNTAHFANITKIQDAVILWNKLKVEKEKSKFQAPVEEEFEDSQGNVVNKKTYEDLKRQGLL